MVIQVKVLSGLDHRQAVRSHVVVDQVLSHTERVIARGEILTSALDCRQGVRSHVVVDQVSSHTERVMVRGGI